MHLEFMRILLIFIPLLVACGNLDRAETINTSGPPISLWSSDSTRFSWGGKEPVLLLGAGNSEEAFLERDYEQKLKILAQAGGNFVALQLDPKRADNPDYRDSLSTYLSACNSEKIAVQLGLSGDYYGERDELTGFLKQFPNVIDKRLSVRGRQLPGSAHWPQLQGWKEEADSLGLPLCLPRISAHGEAAAEGIAAFNRSILAGTALARHAPSPEGDGFSGPALANIRAVRTIERLVKFWDLEPAPEVIPAAAPNTAYAATNGENTFLIYLLTAGEVKLSLGLETQIPLRVTVVGYLGTQKSEILQPPYGETFSLYTEEPRGGWMVIKPL